MILDTIANMERYAGLHPRFATVFDYISKTDLLALANGRHAILGQDLFAIVERVPGRSKSDAQLECHRILIFNWCYPAWILWAGNHWQIAS